MSRGGWHYFVMSLAHELKMTRRQLLNSLDSEELTMWQAYIEEHNKPADQPTAQVEKSLKGVMQTQPKKKRTHA